MLTRARSPCYAAPYPRLNRLTSSTHKLANGSPLSHADTANTRPLVAQTSRPEHVVCLAPTESPMRPAMGRLDKVATYCALMAKPEIPAWQPSCKWTHPGTPAS